MSCHPVASQYKGPYAQENTHDSCMCDSVICSFYKPLGDSTLSFLHLYHLWWHNWDTAAQSPFFTGNHNVWESLKCCPSPDIWGGGGLHLSLVAHSKAHIEEGSWLGVEAQTVFLEFKVHRRHLYQVCLSQFCHNAPVEGMEKEETYRTWTKSILFFKIWSAVETLKWSKSSSIDLWNEWHFVSEISINFCGLYLVQVWDFNARVCFSVCLKFFISYQLTFNRAVSFFETDAYFILFLLNP